MATILSTMIPIGAIAGDIAGLGGAGGAGAGAAAAGPGAGTADCGMFFALAESALATAFWASVTARAIPAGTTRASNFERRTLDTGSDTSTNCAVLLSSAFMNLSMRAAAIFSRAD